MTEENDLISVIVPVYNVENYIDKCLSSIISQSYKNLQIIIVNDGSTDSSIIRCQKYKNDNRITIVEKKNGGLSSARNEGLKKATGKYILFVDSDDYYCSTIAIEELYTLMILNDADIACCSWTSTEKIKEKRKNRIIVYNSEDAISRLLDSRGFKCFAWNKIYKKELFEGVLFPEGELFEDIKTQYRLFEKSNKIVYCDRPLYYYRQRIDSITNRKFTEGNYDLINAINYVMKKVENRDVIEKRLKVGYAFYYLTFVNRAIIAGENIDTHKCILRKHIKDNLFLILFSNSLDFMRKGMLFAFAAMPSLYDHIIYRGMKYFKKVQ